MTDHLALAKEAFDASSTYIDGNWRADWDYSLRAFRNEHAAGSKYLSDEYKARSRLFHPKTRTIIRKNEAAGAVALFSNMDVVNLAAENPDDLMSVASAAAMKEVLEYRLSRTIPAFPICMGALQDAQTTGSVVSYQYWEYEKRGGKKIKDRPCIDLRPIENIRIDGGASWLDPVGSSPYFCDIIPMYVCDVRAMMKNKDDKTKQPKWKHYEDAVILRARPDIIDSTRKSRLGNIQDPHKEQSPIKSFDVVWVMRWFMRNSQGDDEIFYTLGTEELLTDAKPIDEVYFHGVRPYVLGYCIIETHKTLKNGVPMLTKPLQQAANSLVNLRIDNVHFVLSKRWIVARGRNVDVQSLVRGVPGGVTLANDPRNDVQESNWPDVTSSSYAEQDRLNSAFDDLAGNFSPATRVANNAMNDTLGGSRMASQGAGLMTDYLLRTFIETWYEPVLRQLVKLEAHYETDETVLGICANKARLFPRFGLSKITDDMLENDVSLTVNVGMGSSNPDQRLQKFLMATNAAVQLVNTAPPGFNVIEGIKEIFSNAGYRDGARFMGDQQDPRVAKAMQMVQQLQQALKSKQMDLQAGLQETQLKIASNEHIKQLELQTDAARIQGDLQLRAAQLQVDHAKNVNPDTKQLELQQADAEHQREMQHKATVEDARARLETAIASMENERENAKLQMERERAAREQDFLKWRAELEARTKIMVAEIGAKASLDQAQASAATNAERGEPIKEQKLPDIHLHLPGGKKKLTTP